MDKLLKLRKSIILGLLFLVVLGLVFSIVQQYESYTFKLWVYDNFGVSSSVPAAEKINIAKPSIYMSMAISVVSVILSVVFIIFAWSYIKQGAPVKFRKWPYIVIIVFGVLGVAMSLYTVFQNDSMMGSGIKFGPTTPVNTEADIRAEYATNYSGLIKVMMYAAIAVSLIKIGVAIWGLVLTVNDKKQSETMQLAQMSTLDEQVKAKQAEARAARDAEIKND